MRGVGVRRLVRGRDWHDRAMHADDPHPSTLHLSVPGTSLVLDVSGTGLPEIVHWGAALGAAEAGTLSGLSLAVQRPLAGSGPDERVAVTLPPQAGLGYVGLPGLRGHRGGRDTAPVFGSVDVTQRAGGEVVVRSSAREHGLELSTELTLHTSGMLLLRHAVTNTGEGTYVVDGLDVALPLPPVATEILDFTGHHCRERHPQRHPVEVGTWTRATRRGRPGFNSSIGVLVGQAGFGFRSGEVWAMHVAWSGNHELVVDRSPESGTVLLGGELLESGELPLESGETYTTPWVLAAYSAAGIDGISRIFHAWQRSRPSHPGPGRPRRLLLNTWEAVYFDQDLGRLRSWSKPRPASASSSSSSTTAGSGTAATTRPASATGTSTKASGRRGCTRWSRPSSARHGVRALGRARDGQPRLRPLPRAPGLGAAPGDRAPVTSRNQVVLDLAHPEAYAYLLERLDALLSRVPHRVPQVGPQPRPQPGHVHDGSPAAHGQTLALYRLLDELRARHPGTEIESCASGGGRVDLGILERTDRVWTSDSNDALERQTIQRWTSVFIAPELMGAHVGPTRAHTTARTHDLSFRAATALFGHAGIEWDVTRIGDADRAGLTSWIAFYQAHRALLHGGEVVRADHPDPAVWVHGVVSPGRDEALFAVVQLETSVMAIPSRVRLPGLDADRLYRVHPVHPAGPPRAHRRSVPPWLAEGEVILTGRILEVVGLQVPDLLPEQALLLRVEEAG